MGKINERCGGIDIGKRFLFCCALTGAAHEEPRSQTMRFDVTVPGLMSLHDWLMAENVSHVVMESTGSYCDSCIQHPGRSFCGRAGQSRRSKESQRTQDGP